MYYGSAIYLIYYFLRQFIGKALQSNLSEEQILLQKYVEKNISSTEAADL